MQEVVRTYPNNYIKTNDTLKDYLSKGWKVVSSIKMENDIIEYIIEKEENIDYIISQRIIDNILQEIERMLNNVDVLEYKWSFDI